MASRGVAEHEIPFDPPGVPVDVFVMVAGALVSALRELEQLAVTTVPLPDTVEARLVEHEAMRDALNAAPEEWKPRLRELFVGAQQPGLSSGLDAGRVPVFPGVLEGLAAVMEDLRRAALADPGVAAALRQVDGW